ncbi:MAG: DUF72 domain-containing protein [Solirubrobacteraceae bacterium]
MTRDRVRIGCSGWNYASWRNEFYPPKTPASRWLEHYAQHFDTVEVNSTFYRLAKRDAVARWVEQTPPEFCFSVKASRYLTHMKRLTDVGQGLQRFYDPLMPLVESGKLGPVLWQLPPDFRRDDARISALFDALSAHPPSRHCIEFRHPSWFCDEVFELLRWHDVALVVGDRKGLDFQPHEIIGDWTFVRFHFGHRGRRGNYSPGEIAEWAQRIREWSDRAQVWAFYNNDWEVFAPRNAALLKKLLGV